MYCCVVFAGQQVRILGENFTLEDEEDSKIGQVMLTAHVITSRDHGVVSQNYMCIILFFVRLAGCGCLKQGEVNVLLEYLVV